MLIRIDPRSTQPLFEQIAFAVKDAVARGSLGSGDRLPSVRELAQELAINPNTVMRAYEALTSEGVVLKRQGAGVFVTGRPSALADDERQRQLDDLVQRTVTAAFHLGFGADEVRQAVDAALASVRFADERGGNGKSGSPRGKRR